jgi:secondary thiamine-phosphate synthase enzyme
MFLIFPGAGSRQKDKTMTVKNYSVRRKTKGISDIHDITPEVREKVAASGIRDGLVTVFTVGSTAGLTTVEYEPGLVKDLKDYFEKLFPQNARYHHEQTWHDGNGFSHVRASFLKPSLTIPLVGGRMTLGTWQQIVLIDFDNTPRDREVVVQILGG